MAEQQATPADTGQNRSSIFKGSLAELRDKCFPALKYLLSISLIVNFAMLIIGALNVYKCPIKPEIPIFLIVISGINIISHILTFLKDCPVFKDTSILTCFEICGNFTSLIFVALGSFWVYSIFMPSSNQDDGPDYCDKTAYLFAFVYLTIIWVIVLVVFLGYLCFLCCICFVAAMQVDVEGRRSDTESRQPLQTSTNVQQR